MWSTSRLACSLRGFGERAVYRAGGLPLVMAASVAPFLGTGDGDLIRATYLSQFWDFEDPGDLIGLVATGVLWPFLVIGSALWFTRRNGKSIARTFGKSRLAQFREQLRLSARQGILPPWYYVFELYRDDHRARSDDYVSRFETKRGLYPALRRSRRAEIGNRTRTWLGDKLRFEEQCRSHQIPTPAVLCLASAGTVSVPELPELDLFFKPRCGRGGKGAERWDFVGLGYRNSVVGTLSCEALRHRLARLSRGLPFIVQPRLTNHPDLADINNGALSTIRVVTWLNENGVPEVTNAIFRMALGANRTVDNIHAGGIAASVDLETGTLGPATNLGADVEMGWVEVRRVAHPSTGASCRSGRKF